MGGNSSVTTSAARPASLILTKGERPVFKLVRSPSIDHDSDDGTNGRLVDQLNGEGGCGGGGSTGGSSTGCAVNFDESVPLVFNSK